MKIKEILLSSVLIMNVINASPKDGVAYPIADGVKLLHMMRSSSQNIQFIANMYIWGVSVGLDHNYFVIDWNYSTEASDHVDESLIEEGVPGSASYDFDIPIIIY